MYYIYLKNGLINYIEYIFSNYYLFPPIALVIGPKIFFIPESLNILRGLPLFVTSSVHAFINIFLSILIWSDFGVTFTILSRGPI